MKMLEITPPIVGMQLPADIIQVLEECLSLQHEQNLSSYDKIIGLINVTIKYIGKEVILVNETVTLSWHHVEPYLNQHVPDGSDLYYLIDQYFHTLFSKSPVENSSGLTTLFFTTEQIAVAYVDFLRPILLIRNTEYPKVINRAGVVLTEEQFFFCRVYLKNENGKIVRRNLRSILNYNMLLKTLRADEFDFSLQFILGIISGENETRRLQNLRPSNRQPYTITPDGRVVPRLNKQPLYTPDEKKGYSQNQSCTLIDDWALSPAFGFSKGRNSKLYGLMTDVNDSLVTRLMINDSGTVSRIFDFDDAERAMNSHAYRSYKENKFFSRDRLDEFKYKNKFIRQERMSTNEVLARLRFNPYRSVVSICADTLEARLLAYDFAQELLEHYAESVEKSGATLNPDFKIPIIFYLQKNSHKHEISVYTDEMRQRDQAEALAIYNDVALRKQCYVSRNYEFLLGLPEITLEILMEPVNIVPMALTMMRRGYVRMLTRLLRVSRSHSLRDELVDALTKSGFLEQNDVAISQLILAEQFDIADQLIGATNSSIGQLPYGSRLLVSHLQDRGNPRQIKYAVHENTLNSAAIMKSKNWVLIKLYLKEFSTLPQSFLGELLRLACITGEHNTADFLLKRGAPRNTLSLPKENGELQKEAKEIGIAPISIAANNEDWKLVSLFAQYPTDAEDSSEYGFALLKSLHHRQRELAKLLLQAGAKPTWRASGSHKGYELKSALWYAIFHGFNELLPELIEHEKSYQDEYFLQRTVEALELAYDEGNQQAITILQENGVSLSFIDPDNVESRICLRVCNALVLEGEPQAEKRLVRYCQQHQLLDKECDKITKSRGFIFGLFSDKLKSRSENLMIKGLRIILPHIVSIASELSTSAQEEVLKSTMKWLLQCKEASLFDYITDSLTTDDTHSYGRIIINAILENLSRDNIEMVRKVILSRFKGPWKELWETLLNAALNDLKSIKHWNELIDNKALLLYELSPTLPEDLVGIIFESAVIRKKLNIARALLNRADLSDLTKDDLLHRSIRNSFIIPECWALLMLKKNFHVTAAHVEKAASYCKIDVLLKMLDAVQREKYSTAEYQRSFFCVFSYCFHYQENKKLKVIKKLIDIVGSSMIMNFALIYLLKGLIKTKSYKDHSNDFPNIIRYREENKLDEDLVYFSLENYRDSIVVHKIMLQVLNDYFNNVSTPSRKQITNETYHKMMELIGSMIKVDEQSSRRHNDLWRENINESNLLLYRWLQELEQTLVKNDDDKQFLGGIYSCTDEYAPPFYISYAY